MEVPWGAMETTDAIEAIETIEANHLEVVSVSRFTAVLDFVPLL